MRIELICIGDELLSGRTVNTNATVIAQKLGEIGLTLSHVTTIGDVEADLKTALELSLERADVVITTGGLGPTSDDITRDIVASFFEVPLVYEESVAQDLSQRFGERDCGLINQSTIPQGAIPLLNTVGTAPALLFHWREKKLYVLPGVPLEMEAFLDRHIIPNLATKGAIKKSRDVRLMMTFESMIQPFMQELEKKFPRVKFGSYPNAGYLTIRLSGETSEISHIAEILKAEFSESYFEAHSAAEALQQAMIQRGQTLFVVESCTGGRLASELTSISGASQYFKGGVVAYSNEIKRHFLDLSETILNRDGAVSRACVEELAKGALKRVDADYAIAISGIAGPLGATDEKPVGTVWAAIAQRGTVAMSGLIPCNHKAERLAIIDYATYHVIGTLWKWIVHHKKALL